MFIYDNGKVSILSVPRCGHTSMAYHFNQTPYIVKGGLLDWLKSSSRKILVLRNPYDRLQSAQRNAEGFPYVPSDGINTTKEEWIRVHSYPYLIDIPATISFEIIDFYKLSEYISLSTDTLQTNSSSVHHTKLEISPEMRNEYVRYRYYMEYCNEITPGEWKELTENS
jgi:hypothetical protein